MNGDTLEGLVGELVFYKRFEKCIFKSSSKVKPVTYLPSQIRGYSLNDRNFYDSRKLNLEDGKALQAFVIVYVSGEMKLWKYKKRYFLESDDSGVQEVPSLPDEDRGGSQSERLESGKKKLKWYQFLNSSKMECPQLDGLLKEPKGATYHVDDLMEYAIQYNECKGIDYAVYGVNVPLAVIDIGPAISFNNTGLEFSNIRSVPFMFLENAPIYHSGLELGLSIIIRSLRHLSNVSLFLEPHVRPYEFHTQVLIDDLAFPDQIYNDFTIKWLGIGMTTGFRYTIPNVGPQLSLQTGLRFESLLNSKVSLIREQVRIVDNITYAAREEVVPFELAQSQVGLSSQLNFGSKFGRTSKSWEVSLGYILGRGITKSDETSLDIFIRMLSHTDTFFFKASMLW